MDRMMQAIVIRTLFTTPLFFFSAVKIRKGSVTARCTVLNIRGRRIRAKEVRMITELKFVGKLMML